MDTTDVSVSYESNSIIVTGGVVEGERVKEQKQDAGILGFIGGILLLLFAIGLILNLFIVKQPGGTALTLLYIGISIFLSSSISSIQGMLTPGDSGVSYIQIACNLGLIFLTAGLYTNIFGDYFGQSSTSS